MTPDLVYSICCGCVLLVGLLSNTASLLLLGTRGSAGGGWITFPFTPTPRHGGVPGGGWITFLFPPTPGHAGVPGGGG